MSKTTAIAEVRTQLDQMKPQFQMVLPPHVSPDKFMRITMTALQQNPSLLDGDRRSLFSAAMKCAQDGLLPDGREAAFVAYGKQIQYMPMAAGVLKKVRNSGELLSLSTNVVKKQDVFRYWIDDAGEHITHEPNVLAEDRGDTIAAYAIAKTKDGGVYTEVMSRGQIEQVRNVSRAKDSGPWKGWYDEMARKTVLRRLAKRLPMSTDLVQTLDHDNEHYEMGGARAAAASGVDAAKAALGLLETPLLDGETVDPETGEVTSDAAGEQAA
jgi:recombination protein RecT